MSHRVITYKKEHLIAVIDLGVPPKDQEEIVRLENGLSDICFETASDPEIRVVVIRGSREESFSIETDSLPEADTSFSSLAEKIAGFSQPVVVAIPGDAIGQGLELLLACDVRIAAERSHFALPQIQAGLIPWDGGTQRLLRLVGRGKAIEMILTGRMIDAQEAYRIGLISRVVRSEELMIVAMNLARDIASKGPLALRYTKEAVYKGMDMTLEQGLRLEADLYLLLHTTKDRTEGISAFREKRPPRFQGR